MSNVEGIGSRAKSEWLAGERLEFLMLELGELGMTVGIAHTTNGFLKSFAIQL
jgi:hypothetical protein